ncbi:molybdopterin synthase subunit MoaD [Arboricoccus pini]|uniref:Molybdopterin synthase sulfur carrier subunit n=1 Tax=Arboricoccus pini TaxID=1963835 RepID=A0A212RDM7_9PROT|nr:molybdopterin converting factor subunit 1 [Arboricoccus pini]SNB70400.1 molybdopterin synthase subunit MoaD [Arboricoccus pini]
MPLQIRYFAWLKQRTGVAAEEIDLPAEIKDVAALKAWLGRRHPRFAEACAAGGIVRCAVNHDYVEDDRTLLPGDEVAFFPPVTGG